MSSLERKKLVTLVTPVTSVTLVTVVTYQKGAKVTGSNQGPVTIFSCQPCWFPGFNNQVTMVTAYGPFYRFFGNRAKITPVTEAIKSYTPQKVGAVRNIQQPCGFYRPQGPGDNGGDSFSQLAGSGRFSKVAPSRSALMFITQDFVGGCTPLRDHKKAPGAFFGGTRSWPGMAEKEKPGRAREPLPSRTHPRLITRRGADSTAPASASAPLLDLSPRRRAGFVKNGER